MTTHARILTLCEKKHLDQVCLAFEAAWKAGKRPEICAYLGDVPEPEWTSLLRELLLLEVDYRRAAAEAISLADYRAKFPEASELLQEVFRRSGLLPQSDPSPGSRLRYFGDYEILEEIARGGMGVVYKARQISLNRIVALKMILTGQLASRDEVDRFRQEAQAAAGLQHPNIVAIHEVGEYDGRHYFSMDYVEGQSLREMVRESPLPGPRAAHYLKTIAEAVQYAHHAGTIHRDIKPANVLIDRADQPRITDFGLAKQTPAGSQLTTAGQVLGTPNYMPPEQVRGNAAQSGPAGDVYSLGATLYEMLTSRPPFRAETAADTLLQVLQSEPVAPRLLNPKIPRDLETICLKCLEKEPRRRYPSAAELAEDLGRFLGGQPIRARPLGPMARLWRACRRRPVIAGLIVALATTLVCGSAISCYFAIQASGHARDVTDKLWRAYLAEARASRRSRQLGQQFRAMETIASAAAIRPSPELRDEAIACLTLFDLRVEQQREVDPADQAAIDPTLTRYAHDDDQGGLHLHRFSDDQEILSLPAMGQRGYFIFSPDSSRLAREGPIDGKLHCQVWDLGRREVLLTVPMGEQTRFEFTPDSRSIAVVAPDGSIGLFDVKSARLVQRLAPQPNAPVAVLHFHPGGRRLAAFYRGSPTVQILDLDRAAVSQTLSPPNGAWSAEWHPAGELLAVASGDFGIYQFHVETGRITAIWHGHQSEIVGLCYSHRGDVLASRSWDGTMRVWGPSSGEELLRVPQSVLHLQFSADDRRLAFRQLPHVGIWEVASRCCHTQHETSRGGKGPWCVSLHPSGRLIASASDDGVRLWDASAGLEGAFLPLGVSLTVAFHRDGRSLFTCGLAGLKRWPLELDEESGRVVIGPPASLTRSIEHGSPRACLSDDQQNLAAVTGSDTVSVFELPSGRKRAELKGHASLSGVALSPDGSRAVTGNWGGKGLVYWDVPEGRPVRDLLPESGSTSAIFSPDGQWLLGSTRHEYLLWRAGSWDLVRRVPCSGAVAGSMAFSSDSSLLAIALSGACVELIDPTDSERLALLESPNPGTMSSLCFSPDAGLLATAGLNHVGQLWNLRHLRGCLASLALDWDLPSYRGSPRLETSHPVTVRVLVK